PVRMDNPKEVGSDRIVNALAAYTLYRGPCVVVDFGTATSFDAVSAKGEYVGAVTAPGIEISVDALASAGAQLHKVELVRPRSVIAKNAVEALQSGIVYGFAGLVDGIVERMSAELAPDPEDVTVVATGSLAPLVVGEAGSIDVHEPWLTLIGLRLIYQKNTSQLPGRCRRPPPTARTAPDAAPDTASDTAPPHRPSYGAAGGRPDIGGAGEGAPGSPRSRSRARARYP